jgi:protease I
MSKIAMLVGEGYEDAEFQQPYDRFREAGHKVVVLGVEAGRVVKGKRGKSEIEIQHTAADVDPEDFDAVVIPGGYGPDKLRMDSSMVDFVRRYDATGKPLAAICHGPQLLIEAGVVAGRTLTSWPSVRTDLVNAGAQWLDRPLVEDGKLITSRKPDDLDVFCQAVLEWLEEPAEA